jgi:hypothetical protein
MMAATAVAMMNGARMFHRLDSQTVAHIERLATAFGGADMLSMGQPLS